MVACRSFRTLRMSWLILPAALQILLWPQVAAWVLPAALQILLWPQVAAWVLPAALQILLWPQVVASVRPSLHRSRAVARGVKHHHPGESPELPIRSLYRGRIGSWISTMCLPSGCFEGSLRYNS